MHFLVTILIAVVLLSWTIFPIGPAIDARTTKGVHAFLTGVFLFIGLGISMWFRDPDLLREMWLVHAPLMVGVTVMLVGNDRGWDKAIDKRVPGLWMASVVGFLGGCTTTTFYVRDAPLVSIVASAVITVTFVAYFLWRDHKKVRRDS